MISISKTLRTACLAAAFAAASGLAMPPAAFAAAKKMTAEEKKAKSKECSDKADAQKLHGKERKTFREKCKQADS
jgi:predicted aconitase